MVAFTLCPTQPLIQLLKEALPTHKLSTALPPRSADSQWQAQVCKNSLPRWRIRQPQGISYLQVRCMNNHDSDILWWRKSPARFPALICGHCISLFPGGCPVLVRVVRHLLLPSRLLVPKARQVAWHVPAGCDTDIPKAPGSASTHTNPSSPQRHDLKACCCWKSDLTLCHVPPCNTPNISSVNSQT